jgi:hypothetical protein
MMDILAYPYPPGNITTRQAVELIAAVVSPNTNQTEARKRVRERIRYGRKKGKLSQSDSFSAPNFFRWALDENPDWAALASVPGLPQSAIFGNIQDARLPTVTCTAGAVAPPADPMKLREEFIRAEVDRQKLVEEVADKNKQLAELATENAEWRERDRQMRAKRSAAGKRGGRGNSF